MKKQIDTSKLYLAELKRCDKDKGVEYMAPLSYIVIYKENQFFYNIVTGEEHPTYERVPYSNQLASGEEYGTKVRLVSDSTKEQSGLCYLLVGSKPFFPQDVANVSLREVEDAILWSDYYFKDRISIAKRRLLKGENPLTMLKIIKNDICQRTAMDQSINREKVLVKWK